MAGGGPADVHAAPGVPLPAAPGQLRQTLLDDGSAPVAANNSTEQQEARGALPGAEVGSQEPVADPGRGSPFSRERDPPNTAILNLFCAWSIGFLTAIEGTVSVPSLWLYIESLGGTKHYYGFCVSAFAIGKFSMMGIYGMWVDRRPFKEVFIVSLVAGMFSGLLYAAAPTVGLWSIAAGRLLLGMTSAQMVATQAFVSTNTSMADRTRYMSINTLVINVLTLAGPAFNALIILLPEFSLTLGSRVLLFNSYTWVGYFLLTGQLLVLTFISCCFREPDRQQRRKPQPLSKAGNVLTLCGLLPWARIFMDPWLHKTGSWFIFILNFRNVFTVAAVNFTVPLVTSRDYGWGQMENSYIFMALAIESIVSTLLIGYASKRNCDRNLITIWGLVSHSGLLAYVLLSGFGTHKIPAWLFVACLVWYDSGTIMPATQGLYSKLIGAGNAGLYFSVLQSNGSMATVFSGEIVGLAYGSVGAPCLWVVVHSLWGVSWVFQFFMWKRLHPDYIDALHERLGAPSGKGQGKGTGKAKGNCETMGGITSS